MRMLRAIGRMWEGMQLFFCSFFNRTYMCDCGHRTKWQTILTIHGQRGRFTVSSKKPEYCAECWAKAAIICAWCDGSILPGDPITLYTPTNDGHKIPDHAVVYKQEPLQLVGCLRWECSETGADRAGFWVMPGKVQRVLSPIEQLIAGGCEGAIIINDLADQSQAILISEEEVVNEKI